MMRFKLETEDLIEMSQEKVTKYKEAKANRKELMKKEKKAKQVRKVIAGIVCVVVLGWVGYSAVTYLQENQPRQEVEVDYSAIDEYADTLAE